MDTTEELYGYFYAGMPNLSAKELLFWIMVDTTLDQLGVEDGIAVAAIILGDNSIMTRAKPRGATPGTSHASKFFRKHLNYELKERILPTLTTTSIKHLQIRWVNNIGVFVGRAVPVVGWVIAAYDVCQIAYKTVTKYNTIARGDDKIWG